MTGTQAFLFAKKAHRGEPVVWKGRCRPQLQAYPQTDPF